MKKVAWSQGDKFLVDLEISKHVVLNQGKLVTNIDLSMDIKKGILVCDLIFVRLPVSPSKTF